MFVGSNYSASPLPRQLIVHRCLRVVPDPEPRELRPYIGLAGPEDLPILVATIREGCLRLITFNVRHFRPGHSSVRVLRPGDFIIWVREVLAMMGA
ncbi:MAG: hypothetical protein N0A03_09945 [Anaerolineae bacterium]|nr:hypothetical protein [Anaerolineae bacterium]MCX8068849.1 hypothetical protein [Anaerolineae bacterium]